MYIHTYIYIYIYILLLDCSTRFTLHSPLLALAVPSFTHARTLYCEGEKGSRRRANIYK